MPLACEHLGGGPMHAAHRTTRVAPQAMPDFTPDGRPNFGKMMHEKRETISQLRDKGHPVDRRDKYEDGQPSREQYSPKEERELLKRAVSVHRFADRICGCFVGADSAPSIWSQ